MRDLATEGLAPSGQEQLDDDVAEQEAERDGERDAELEVVRRGREPRQWQVLQRECEGDDAGSHEQGQGVHEKAGSAEGRSKAEEAIGHQQEQGDERLRHVLVEHHGGVDAQGQGEATENGERQGDPSAATDPMARPLQGGQHRQQHELHHGDVGKDLGPVCQCVGPLTPLPSPSLTAEPSPRFSPTWALRPGTLPWTAAGPPRAACAHFSGRDVLVPDPGRLS